MKKNIIFLLMGIALVIGLGEISYPYDELLKVLVCVMGVFGAYSSHNNKQFKWVWILGGVALMFNPFLQALKDDDEVWRILSRIAGLIFIIYFLRSIKVVEILKELSNIAKEFLKSFGSMDRKWKIRATFFLCFLGLLLFGLWGRSFLLGNYFRMVADGAPWQVALAIKAGADVNAKDYVPILEGKHAHATAKELTAMELAAAYNPNPETIKVLAQAGAYFGKASIFPIEEIIDGITKPTPLMYAAKYNPNPEVVKTLIQLGADINKQDSSGLTALMYAADSHGFGDQRSQIIKLLVESGADITLRGRKRVFEVGPGDVPVIEGTAFDFLEGNPEARKNKDFAQLEKLLNPGDKAQPKI